MTVFNMRHIDYLCRIVPDMNRRSILDIGAGKGAFVIAAAQEGFDVMGIEFNPDYIAYANEQARRAGVTLCLVQGQGERLPFPDSAFGFVNLSEVIEHVDNPSDLSREIWRVLKPGGMAYLSAPNRYGARDPHYHLYGLNWLPRKWANKFIAFFGRHKDYSNRSAGRQRIDEMHYYTFPSISSLLINEGFSVTDIREKRIKQEFPKSKRLIARLVYPILRTVYFDSFHLIIIKPL